MKELNEVAGAAEEITNSKAFVMVARMGFAVSGLFACADRVYRHPAGTRWNPGRGSQRCHGPAGPATRRTSADVVLRRRLPGFGDLAGN